MFDKFKRYYKKDKKEEIDDKYLFIPKDEINEGLKRNIIKLERLGNELSKVLQVEYSNEFERQGKSNLKIWVCRDIDGDEINELTSDSCLELEYRSQIAIDYEGPKNDEDFYADALPLWSYGCCKASGTLYDISKDDLETYIEEILIELLEFK
ncbi:hypothetical protein [Peribacillus sp. TH27]|uniref:hypothetical protein n=1 Tax=Peribacillus sp. TH27 TaxID=2798484 RepID=UPI001911A674|nr:hypothetical protein [Peribacillus sp. TH27]MBK5463007.1 hypothetical protein [Peribacillus sp. TH27]